MDDAIETAKVTLAARANAEGFRSLAMGSAMIARGRLAELIEASGHYPDAHDDLRITLASRLRDGSDLSDPERHWLADSLAGRQPRPVRKGRPANDAQILAVAAAVATVSALHGMNPTRNDTSEPHSACDAVAAAARDLGWTCGSYERVRKIWYSVQKQPEIKAT